MFMVKYCFRKSLKKKLENKSKVKKLSNELKMKSLLWKQKRKTSRTDQPEELF